MASASAFLASASCRRRRASSWRRRREASRSEAGVGVGVETGVGAPLPPGQRGSAGSRSRTAASGASRGSTSPTASSTSSISSSRRVFFLAISFLLPGPLDLASHSGPGSCPREQGQPALSTPTRGGRRSSRWEAAAHKGVGARRRGIPPLPPSFRLPRRLRGTGRRALFGCHPLFSCPLPWRDREEGLKSPLPPGQTTGGLVTLTRDERTGCRPGPGRTSP
jgi:hypothetical protein